MHQRLHNRHLWQGTELRATFSCDSAGKSVESLVTYGKVGELAVR